MAKNSAKSNTSDNVESQDTGAADAEASDQDLTNFRVKYTGPLVHRRVLNAKDFSAAGIEDVTKKEWSVNNNHTVDFSEYEGDKSVLATFFRQDAMKKQFKILKPGEL